MGPPTVSNFFANALTYLVPSEMDCRAAVTDLTEAALKIASGDDTSLALSILQTLCKCIIERREYVTRAMLDILENCFLEVGEGPRFAFCAMILSGEDNTTPFRRPPLLDLSLRDGKTFKRDLRLDYGAEHLRTHSPRIFIPNGTATLFSELFESHGLAMLTDDRRPWVDRREPFGPSLIMGLVLVHVDFLIAISAISLRKSVRLDVLKSSVGPWTHRFLLRKWEQA